MRTLIAGSDCAEAANVSMACSMCLLYSGINYFELYYRCEVYPLTRGSLRVLGKTIRKNMDYPITVTLFPTPLL
jgi:hypothetical protein